MLLKLEKLRFQGIGRFVDEQTIYFTKLGKLVQIDGKNNNTGGSSASGKSTILMAFDYLLKMNKTPSTVLKTRNSEDSMFVEGTFDVDGKSLIIYRGKKLSVTFDGVTTTGSSAKTEEEIDKFIGMSRDLFRKMVHKRQKEGGFFLQMTPSEVNDFLTKVLGLEKVKADIAVVDNDIDKLSDEKKTITESLIASRAALTATQEAILSMGKPPEKEVNQSTILELKDKSSKSDTALALLNNIFKSEEETLNASRPQVSTVPFDRVSLEELEKVYKEAEKTISQAESQERERVGKAKLEASQLTATLSKLRSSVEKGDLARDKAKEIADQIKQIREGKCYTCGQDWLDAMREAKMMSEIKTLRTVMETGKLASEQIPALEAQTLLVDITPRKVDTSEAQVILQESGLKIIALRQQEKEHLSTESLKNKTILDEFAQKTSAMRSRHLAGLYEAQGQAELDRRVYEAALGKFRAYGDAIARYEATRIHLSAQETAHKGKIDELISRSETLDFNLELAEETKRGLKSFLSCSFDDALETIGENATALIRHIPNMANATIQLEGTRETQKGAINEEITAVIHLDGDPNVDIRSLCGGERTAMDLAIDLSVIDLLENKANKGINIFFLDEPFDGLDTVCIEMALEVLKNSNSNKRLIIIDHNPEVKEMVESRLVVVREGATSKVVQ